MSNSVKNVIIAVTFVIGTVLTVLNTIYTQDKMLEEGRKTQEMLRP